MALTPQQQDEKRVSHIVENAAKVFNISDTDSPQYRLIKSFIVQAYQMGHCDGVTDQIYNELGIWKESQKSN